MILMIQVEQHGQIPPKFGQRRTIRRQENHTGIIQWTPLRSHGKCQSISKGECHNINNIFLRATQQLTCLRRDKIKAPLRMYGYEKRPLLCDILTILLTVTIMVQNTPQQPFQSGPIDTPKHWSSSRFGCLDDIPSCLMSFFCGCIIFGQTMERAHIMGCVPGACYISCASFVPYLIISTIGEILGADWSFSALVAGSCTGAYAGMLKRKELTEKYRGLEWAGDCNEWILWCCCGCCSLAQEYKTVMRNVDYEGQWIEIGHGTLPQASTTSLFDMNCFPACLRMGGH